MNPVPAMLLPPPQQLELAALLYHEMLMRTFSQKSSETPLSEHLCTQVREFGAQMQWNIGRINSLLDFLLTYTLPDKKRKPARRHQLSGAQYDVSKASAPQSVADGRVRDRLPSITIDKQVSISLADTLAKNGVVPIRRLPHPLSHSATVSTL
jgi:hypothetical protein